MEIIVLASASPRRLDFFRLLGLPFVCSPAMIDETPVPGLDPGQMARDLAEKKARTVAAALKGAAAGTEDAPWVFAADTVVAVDGEILDKPGGRDQAARSLERLSARRHEVTTAMALYNARTGGLDLRSVACEVEFARLSPAEIEWYVNTGEWRGAAGGYRLQERGGCLIKSVNGSPSAVAGLPLREFYVMLTENGYRFGA